MARLNRAEIIGHIGVDPVLKHTNTNNVPVVNLRVATNEGWTDKASGQRQEATTWHTVVCYRRLAEIVAQHMAKGRQVYVSGRMNTREYTVEVDHQINISGQLYTVKIPERRFVTEIIADDVQFLGKNPNSQAYPQTTGAPVVAAAPAAAPVVAAAGDPAAAAATFVNPAAAPAAPLTPVQGV